MTIDDMTPYENVEITIEESLERKLEERAEGLNMTKEELVRHILLDAISTEITIEDFENKLQEISDDDSTPEFLKQFWIVTKDGKPIVRCIPISCKEHE
jgi:hypothetical protein